METFLNITLGCAAFYNIVMALVVSTKTWQAALIFKVIPMFIGLACLVGLLYTLGLING